MNNITLIGNLGSTPLLRSANGTPVADLEVAVNRRFTVNGQQREETVWFKVVCWRALAQTVSTYLAKGRQVAVVGRMEAPEAYIDRDGNARARNRVTALNVQFLGANPDSSAADVDEAIEAAATVPMPSEEEIAAMAAAF